MAKLRIVLADDHRAVREGLKMLINTEPDMEVIGEASNGKEAFQKVLTLHPQVIVMDVNMPECNGAEAAERLKEACSDVRVLALTVHEDETYLRQLLRAGAAGYVLKRTASEELTRAIRLVASGGTYLDPTLADKVVAGYLDQSPADGDAAAVRDLSQREEEVLRLIAWGYALKEIAARLQLSVKTVETYRNRLLRKLGLRSRTDIVRFALRQGWLKED